MTIHRLRGLATSLWALLACLAAAAASVALAAPESAASGALKTVAASARLAPNATTSTAPVAAMAPTAARDIIEKYCLDCHNPNDYKGGLELEVFDPGDAHDDAQISEKMIKKLRAGMMPPAGKPRPDASTIQSFVTTLETDLDAHAKLNLSAPKLHRLNRAEYENAVRDVLGVDIDSTKFLPTDDSSRGFDNQAAALTLSPALLDAYISAAARVSRVAIGTAISPTQVTYRVPEDTTQNYHVEGLPFGTRGGLSIDHTFPADGTYTFKVFSVNLGNMGNFRPFGEIKGEKLLVYVDDKRVANVDWDEALGVNKRYDDEGGGQLKTIDVKLPVTAGLHRIGVTFLATNYAPGLDMNLAFDRSTIETGGLPGFTFYPHIGSVRVDGPADGKVAADSPSRERIYVCHPAKPSDEQPCARQIAAALARRAYRGYATPEHVDTLMKFYALGRRNGGTFDNGIEAVVQRVLADPKFLFRMESTPANLEAGTAYHVSDLDLASRLSFFLWSSIPDDTLLQLAETAQLSKPEVLRAQVERMLDDPKAAAFTRNFAGQWLGLRSLSGHQPVVDQFPDFDDNLRESFREEVELLFTSLLKEDRSILDLLTADYTFVNGRLAKFYGIPGIKGSEFRRVKLGQGESDRWGLLGKGALLTVSSQPGRTSPTIRGNWVLKFLIGVPAPDPPANVPALKAGPGDAAGNNRPPTMREQMETHRANPACAGCHKLMDPIGFALEPFDAIGRERSEDGGNKIDASGTMYDGVSADGPAGVRAFILRHQDQYVRNVTQNLMTYAVGRGMEYDDMPMMRSILKTAAKDNYRFKGLIDAVVESDLFRMNVATGDTRVEEDAPPRSGMLTAPAGDARGE
jgi:mono/diheme cytochrome c family protein